MSPKEAPAEQHIVDLIPGFALNSLNEYETRLVSEHLGRCDACRAELEAYRRVADELYLAVPHVIPPPELKQRLMNSLPGELTPAAARNTAAAKQPARPAPNRRWGLRPAWALAGMLLVTLLAVGNIWLWQRLRTLEASTPEYFRVVSLAGTENAPGATGVLVMDSDGDHGTLVVDGLPVLDPEQQYQLWLIRDGQRKSAGVFSVSPEGYGSLMVESDQPLYTASGFGITVEPAGGSPGPTGARVMAGTP